MSEGDPRSSRLAETVMKVDSSDKPTTRTDPKFLSNTVMDLQLSIRSLVNERRELQLRLAGGKNRGRNAGYPGGVSRGVKRDRDAADAAGQAPISVTDKRPAGLSTIAKVSRVPLEVAPDSFPVEKRPKITLDDSSIKRNRNLFGSLLGHLKKAKTRLDSEKTTKTAELQRLAEQQVSQKLDLERRNLAELRRRDFQERQRRDLARMRDVQRELQVKETEILSLNLQNHFNLMKNFIRTDTTPMIFWIPALHNEETKRLQEITRQQIESKVESLVGKFTVPPLSEMQDDLPPSWNHSHQNQDDVLMDQPHMSEQPHPKDPQQLNQVPTVHPDLINDSDEEEDYQPMALHNAEDVSMTTSEPAAVQADPADSGSCTTAEPLNEEAEASEDYVTCTSAEKTSSPKQDMTVAIEEDEEEMVDTVPLNASSSEVMVESEAQENVTNEPAPAFVQRTYNDLRTTLVKDLQQELKALGLSASGRKDDLVDRLAAALKIPKRK